MKPPPSIRLSRLRFGRKRLMYLAGAASAAWVLAWFALPFALPLPESLNEEAPASRVIADRHGTPIHRLSLPDFSRGRPVALTDIPREFIDCTLAAEDRRFYRHGGVDLLATCRAGFDWLRRGHAVSGASTVTQQLVKISSPPAPRNLATKFREVLLARRLEMTRSKDWILAAYLNRLDYGQLRRGPAEAARHFFQKPLGDLSLGECALLAGLPQAPSRLDPTRHPDRALARRSVVLDRLARHFPYENRRIARARAEPLRLRPLGAEAVHAPWLPASLSRLAAADGANASDGSIIRTTLDLPIQRDVEAIVREELSKLAGTNARHAAVVVLDNGTGDIVALVNSGNWDDPLGGQLNGALLPRSPGSTLKPFTYLLAFERGGAFPGSIIADVPTRFRTGDGLDAPENYDHTYRGPVTIRVALASSLNVAAMRQLNGLGGPKPLFQLLTRLGIDTLGPDPTPYGLGLTIGNAPVRLLDLANAYATIARRGILLPPRIIHDPQPSGARQTGAHRQPRRGPAGGPDQSTIPDPQSPIFSPTSAFLVADILSDPEARATAFGPAASIRLPFRCAVKTGTSSDFHDNWCLGFTPEITVGVWVGNFEFNPMTGVSGITGAGPVFRRVMARAHRDRPATWFNAPSDLARIEIDPRIGKRADDSLPRSVPRVAEWCPQDRFPLVAASSDYDDHGRARLDPTYREWFESAPLADRSRFTLDPDRPAPRPLRILAPSPGATYFLDPELPTGGRRLRLATNFPGLAEWSSPTLEIQPTRPEPTALLVPGAHTLVATDPRSGERHQITIHVESL